MTLLELAMEQIDLILHNPDSKECRNMISTRYAFRSSSFFFSHAFELDPNMSLRRK